MTDITNLFRATVKALKTRQRAQGQTVVPDKNILGSTKHRGEFHTKAKQVIADVSKLKEFILEHRKDYINVASSISGERSRMSDVERDQIDADAQTFMRLSAEAIKHLLSLAFTNHVSQHVQEHREAVLALMKRYLKDVCSLHSEQRAIRVKRVVDRKRLSRLEPDRKRKKTAESVVERNGGDTTGDGDPDGGDKPSTSDRATPTHVTNPAPHAPDHQDSVGDELSPEEVQMFQLENQQMFDEMNTLVDEVKQIEGKVVEISRLQEIFADKILEQEGDIERVADAVVGTTENIKEANEDIREAMKNNAGLRVWILFFLIVCSLSLLFLDWYNV